MASSSSVLLDDSIKSTDSCYAPNTDLSSASVLRNAGGGGGGSTVTGLSSSGSPGQTRYSSPAKSPLQRIGNTQVQQLFARVHQELEDQKPANVIHFVVDFLCKHYPEHLQGFAAVWNGDPELERERLLVVEFFKAQKLPTDIAAHFTNAGFDTLETLCTLTSESLDDIERFNQTRWLPGHKVRLQQTFSDIAGRVRVFREERDALIRAVRGNMSYCHHPTVISKPNVVPSLPAPRMSPPGFTSCLNNSPCAALGSGTTTTTLAPICYVPTVRQQALPISYSTSATTSKSPVRPSSHWTTNAAY